MNNQNRLERIKTTINNGGVYKQYTNSIEPFLEDINAIEKALKELDLYKEMSEIYRRNYQVQMCLNDRLRLIEIEKELGL